MKDDKSPLIVSKRCVKYYYEPYIRQCKENLYKAIKPFENIAEKACLYL